MRFSDKSCTQVLGGRRKTKRRTFWWKQMMASRDIALVMQPFVVTVTREINLFPSQESVSVTTSVLLNWDVFQKTWPGTLSYSHWMKAQVASSNACSENVNPRVRTAVNRPHHVLVMNTLLCFLGQDSTEGIGYQIIWTWDTSVGLIGVLWHQVLFLNNPESSKNCQKYWHLGEKILSAPQCWTIFFWFDKIWNGGAWIGPPSNWASGVSHESWNCWILGCHYTDTGKIHLLGLSSFLPGGQASSLHSDWSGPNLVLSLTWFHPRHRPKHHTHRESGSDPGFWSRGPRLQADSFILGNPNSVLLKKMYIILEKRSWGWFSTPPACGCARLKVYWHQTLVQKSPEHSSLPHCIRKRRTHQLYPVPFFSKAEQSELTCDGPISGNNLPVTKTFLYRAAAVHVWPICA